MQKLLEPLQVDQSPVDPLVPRVHARVGSVAGEYLDAPSCSALARSSGGRRLSRLWAQHLAGHGQTLETRLSELRALMHHLPTTSMVVFEDAAYHVPQTRSRVRHCLIDRVDVYSMNEDEMEDLLGHRIDLLDPADVGAAARKLAGALNVPIIVVHTQYWSLAVGLESERFRTALQAGVSTASARYVCGDDVTLHDLHAIDGRDRHPRGAALARAVENLLPGRACCVASPLVSSANPTTVGLGDAFVGGFIAGMVAPR